MCSFSLRKDNQRTSGALFEVSGGWVAQTRWERSGGYSFPAKVPYTPEDVVAKWSSITNFSTFISIARTNK